MTLANSRWASRQPPSRARKSSSVEEIGSPGQEVKRHIPEWAIKRRICRPRPTDSVNAFANYPDQAPPATTKHTECSPFREIASPDEELVLSAEDWAKTCRTHTPGPFDSVNAFADYSNQAPRATTEHTETISVRETASPEQEVTAKTLPRGRYTPSNPPSCASASTFFAQTSLDTTKYTGSDLRHKFISSPAGSIMEDVSSATEALSIATDLTEAAFKRRTFSTTSNSKDFSISTAIEAPPTIIADDGKVIEIGWFPSDELRPLDTMKEVLKKPHRDPKDKWWTMHREYHDGVSKCLEESEFDLYYTFNQVDSREAYLLNEWTTKIPGHFICHNRHCRWSWKSQAVGILIRRYTGHKYNARVYWQACRRCDKFTQPNFHLSPRNAYEEHIAYAIKAWNGVTAKLPRYPRPPSGPHRIELCGGCQSGRCPLVNQLSASKNDNEWLKNRGRQRLPKQTLMLEM